jgi:hypothetical protein
MIYFNNPFHIYPHSSALFVFKDGTLLKISLIVAKVLSTLISYNTFPKTPTSSRIAFSIHQSLRFETIHPVENKKVNFFFKVNKFEVFVWTLDHPPPAVYLLISGDINYTNTLHLLQMRMYTVLLAQIIASAAFAKATKYVWSWPSNNDRK